MLAKVVEHMASEGSAASPESLLISTIMQYLGHESMQHRLPTVVAALIDKTSDPSVDLDARWEFREAEMRVQYCWNDLFAFDMALDKSQQAKIVTRPIQRIIEVLREYLERRLAEYVLKYRQAGERLRINTDEFFIEHGTRADGTGGGQHAGMFNLLGNLGGTTGRPVS